MVHLKSNFKKKNVYYKPNTLLEQPTKHPLASVTHQQQKCYRTPLLFHFKPLKGMGRLPIGFWEKSQFFAQ